MSASGLYFLVKASTSMKLFKLFISMLELRELFSAIFTIAMLLFWFSDGPVDENLAEV